MIRITKASSNTIAVTLSEKCTLTTPYFLFSFICDQTQKESLFVAQDVSTTDERVRFNKFVIVEKASNPNPLIGEVTLSTTSWYSYTIYEQTSATNLVVANTTGIVETGKVFVNTTADTDYTYSPTTTQDYVYTG